MPPVNDPSLIKFVPRQRPDPILPQNGNGSLMDPLGVKAQERVVYAIEKVEQSARGERPVLRGDNKGGKWVGGQLTDMSNLGFLPQEPRLYFTTREDRKVLGYNPTSNYLVEGKQALLEELGRDIPGMRVAGTGIALKRPGQIEREKDRTRLTVALPGDMNTLQEMLSLIKKKINDGQLIDRPLIIENPQYGEGVHFWDEILRGFKFLERESGKDPIDRRAYVDFKALAHHYGIYITEQRSDTVELVQTLDDQLPELPDNLNELKSVIPDGAVFFVATGTMKKYEELEHILKKQGVNVRIRNIFEIVDTYQSPKELSGTYEGNVAEKAEAALQAWHEMDEQTRVDRLKHLGITKDQAFFLAEDSGFHFMEPDLVLEDEFGDIRHKLDINAPFPGVETGPGTIGSNGIANFMKKISAIFGRRPNADKRVISKSVLALAPLNQRSVSSQDMYMVGAETTCTFTTVPSPNDGTIEISNYLIPTGLPGLPKGQTEKQLGKRFEEEYSARATAWKSLAFELGLSTGNPDREHDYSPYFAAGIVADFRSATRRTGNELQKQTYDDGFGVVTLDPRVENAKDPQDKIFSKADGIVLAFNPKKAKENFWRNLYILTSAIVAEQTHDKYKFRKPTYIVNPNGEFDDLVKLVYDFHHLGTVPEDPESLIKQAGSVEEAVDKLQEDRKSYRRYHLPAYATQEEPFETDGVKSGKDFNVGVILSASSENAKYLEQTEQLANGLIDENIGGYSGGGAYGPMGVFTNVYHRRRNTDGAWHGASNCPHIMSGEGDVSQVVSEFFPARDIYERMEYILKADAVIALPGGTGTVQEAALAAIVMDRIAKAKKGDDLKGMNTKDIILVNTKINHMGKKRGFYDVLLDIIPEEELERLNIHVVKNVDQALKKTRELKAQKAANTPLPSAHQNIDAPANEAHA